MFISRSESTFWWKYKFVSLLFVKWKHKFIWLSLCLFFEKVYLCHTLLYVSVEIWICLCFVCENYWSSSSFELNVLWLSCSSIEYNSFEILEIAKEILFTLISIFLRMFSFIWILFLLKYNRYKTNNNIRYLC